MADNQFKTINVEGFGDIQVPSAYGDNEIKQHVQQLQSIKQATNVLTPLASKLDFRPTPGMQVQQKLRAMHYQLDPVDQSEVTSPGDLLIHGLQTGREQLSQAGASIGSTIAERVATGAAQRIQPGSMEAAAARRGTPTTTPQPLPPEVLGTVRGAGGFVGGVAADPFTYLYGELGTLGRGGRVATGIGFGTQMGAGAVESAGELGKVLDRSDIPVSQKYEMGTQTVLQTLMAGVAGAHGVSEGRGMVSDYMPRPSERLVPGSMDPLIGEKPATPVVALPSDTDHYARARTEWQQQNPGKDPYAPQAISAIARRAQEFKDIAQAPPSTQPTTAPTSVSQMSPEEFFKKTGAKPSDPAQVESLKAAIQRGETLPKPSITLDRDGNVVDSDGRHRMEAHRQLGTEQVPVEIHTSETKAPVMGAAEPTVTPAGVHDLRGMDPNARHEWLRTNAPFALEADNIEQARARARQMWGPKFQVQPLQFIDTTGKTQYAARFVPTGEPGVVAPQAPGPVSREIPEGAHDAYVKIQNLEGDFHQLTGGKHGEVLNQLLAHVDANLPPNSPIESRLSLYAKGLRELKIALVQEGGLPKLQQAFEKAAQRTQAGVLAPVTGMKGLTQSQIDSLNKLHVDTMLGKWEGYPDQALTSRKVLKSLQDPAFKNSVAGTQDPVQQARYDSLLTRAGAAKASDPVAALGRTLTNSTLTPGDLTRGSLRENLAISAHSAAIQAKALDSYVKDWNRRPLHDSINFIDSIESGNINSIADPADRAMAQKLRDMLDEKRQQVQDLDIGALDSFYENYFPHVWKFGVKDLASQILSGRRPLRGGQGFLRERTYNSFAEGIANGMEPVTYNPVNMALLKLHEMDRFMAAHRTFADLKDMGLVQQFSRDKVPEGWVRLNDPMFESKTLPQAGATSVDPPTLIHTKAWYAPADAARPINNHLSPGLRGNALFDSVTAYNNLLNQANLGLSAFHGVETAVNAMVSTQAVELGKILRGDVSLKGVGKVALSPVAGISKYITGTKLLQEYMEPGRFSAMADTAKALDMAGGRVSMPSEFKNAATEGMRNAWKEAAAAPTGSFKQLAKGGQAVYRSIGAAFEKASSPLMEYYVPRVKLGVFADMAKDTMERLGPQASPEVLRAELSKVWDSVDNRFGQVVYDNLFWNRMGKDLAHMTVRSVGWNMGTFRELGGGVWDLKDTLRTGNLSPRQTYTLALLGSTAMMGYLINHAYSQKVDSPIDLLYPKTGKIGLDGSPERIYLKTYVHDAYGFAHAPGQTAVNKLAPIWHQVGDLYSNADYFDRQIHPVHATNLDALTDPKTYTGILQYEGKEALPFSATNVIQRMRQGESFKSAASSGLAILPAPRWAGESKAEALSYSLYRTHLQRGPNDAEASERLQKYHQLATGYVAGTVAPKDLYQAFKAGTITSHQYDGILEEGEGKLTALERHTKRLSANEFLRVFDVATPSEKMSLKDTFYSHWDHVADNEPGGADSDLFKQYTQRSKQLLQSGQKSQVPQP